ncbi:hypothetical protein JCM6882_005839 [Rhodosporidiobolus microsporus]
MLADAASSVAPTAADVVGDASFQPKKELDKGTKPAEPASKEESRVNEQCAASRLFPAEVQELVKQEFDRHWLMLFKGLLEFPGASGLDTPFFLFLQNLHFVPGGERLGISRPPSTTLSNPLLIDMYGSEARCAPAPACPLAASGAVPYLRVVNPPKGFFSVDIFWSLFASFDEVFNLAPRTSLRAFQGLRALEGLKPTLSAHRLSLFPATTLAIHHFTGSPQSHHLLTPLNTASSFSSLASEPLRLTVDSKVLGNTSKATVFCATTNDGVKVVVKYSKSDKLVHEAEVLSEINHLEPDLAPKCYGLFSGSGLMKGYRALVLEHGGDAVPGFRELKTEECTEIFDLLTKLHRLGFEHHSFACRNVVRDAATGRFRLIDFERAKRRKCKGGEACEELREACDALRLGESVFWR